MGQVLEAILTSLAQMLGIEAAKFALGDVFPFLVVTGMVWFGAVLFAFLLLDKVMPTRDRNNPAPVWEKVTGAFIFVAITVGVVGGSTYLFLSGF